MFNKRDVYFLMPFEKITEISSQFEILKKLQFDNLRIAIKNSLTKNLLL